MVYFEDTGAMIDASIEIVWKYMVSSAHGPAHARDARKFKLVKMDGPTVVISAERLLRGRWSNFVTRTTDHAPLCICAEEIRGDFAGTKFVQVYRPRGKRTQVDAYGDIRSEVFPPAKAKRLFLETLKGAYDDGMVALRKFRRRRRA